jgi:Family of unknown function (DUF5681)
MQESEIKRKEDGTWRKGQSGNPSGKNGHTPISDALRCLLTRAKGDIQDDEIRTIADEIAAQWLEKGRKGELAAITSLTERIEGKPTQAVELGGKDGGDIGLSIRGEASVSVRSVVSALTKGRADSSSGKAKVDKPSKA